MYSDARRLVREAHIHHHRGVALRGGQIDQAAFAQQVNFAAVFHRVFFHERTRDLSLELASFSSAGMSISTLKWPELQTTAPSLIFSKCSCGEDGLVAGDRDENLADFRGVGHGHHAETVHDGFDAPASD